MSIMEPIKKYGNSTVRKYQLIWYNSPRTRARKLTSIHQMMHTGMRHDIVFTAYGISSQKIYQGTIVDVTMSDGTVERGKCIGHNTIVMYRRPKGPGGGQTRPQPIDIIVKNGGRK